LNSLLRELKKLVTIYLIELNRQVKKQLGFRMVSSIDTDLVVIETEFESEIHEFIVNNNKKKELIEVDFPNTEVIK
jgi:DNA-binding sugar fermentation-stimulating protein